MAVLAPPRAPDNGAVDPPAPAPEDGGRGDAWATLVVTENDIEAHLLTGRLAEVAIEARLLKDRSAPGAWLHGGSDPWAPVTVLVRQLQLQDARIVLAELALTAAPAERVVPSPRRWRGPILWWTGAVALGILFTGLGLAQAANDLGRCNGGATCAPDPRRP